MTPWFVGASGPEAPTNIQTTCSACQSRDQPDPVPIWSHPVQVGHKSRARPNNRRDGRSHRARVSIPGGSQVDVVVLGTRDRLTTETLVDPMAGGEGSCRIEFDEDGNHRACPSND